MEYTCNSTGIKGEVIVSCIKIHLVQQLISKKSGGNSARCCISCCNFYLSDIGNWLVLFKWMSDVAKRQENSAMGSSFLIQQGTRKPCCNCWLIIGREASELKNILPSSFSEDPFCRTSYTFW